MVTIILSNSYLKTQKQKNTVLSLINEEAKISEFIEILGKPKIIQSTHKIPKYIKNSFGNLNDGETLYVFNRESIFFFYRVILKYEKESFLEGVIRNN